MSGRALRLGTAEQHVLAGLARHNGSWTKDAGWKYDSVYWTLRLLASLANKGLVEEVTPDEHYRLSDAGRAVLPSLATGDLFYAADRRVH